MSKEKIIVVACIDSRIHPEEILGIKHGEAHVIRNAGGIVTEDVIRSILFSMHAADNYKVIIIDSTDCGLEKLDEADFRKKLIKKFGTDTIIPTRFYSFEDPETNVKHQMQRVTSHPWLKENAIVRGFVYDFKTKELKEVK